MIKQPKYPHIFTTFAILIVAVLALAACSGQSAATQPAQSTAPTSAVQMANTNASSPAKTTPAASSSNSSGADASSVSFSKDIAPIFQTSCVNCHGGERTSKALDLKTFASLMAGSQNGAVITPGDAASSKLVQSVQSGKMPKRGTKLTADQIRLLVDWVNAGAKNN